MSTQYYIVTCTPAGVDENGEPAFVALENSREIVSIDTATGIVLIRAAERDAFNQTFGIFHTLGGVCYLGDDSDARKEA